MDVFFSRYNTRKRHFSKILHPIVSVRPSDHLRRVEPSRRQAWLCSTSFGAERFSSLRNLGKYRRPELSALKKKTIHQQGGRGNGVLEHWVRKTLNIYELSEVQMYVFFLSSKFIPSLGVKQNIQKFLQCLFLRDEICLDRTQIESSEAYADPQLIEDPTMKAREKPSPSNP